MPDPAPSAIATHVLCGEILVADPSGALAWPEAATVIVADLHFEKGSSIAGLPPYDTAATLARLALALERWRPRRVVCLGDSFHDRKAALRLSADDGATLAALVAAHEWLWVAGNHDPQPPGRGGRAVAEVAIGPLVFRHEAAGDASAGEISGHFHPKVSVSARGRRLGGRCFIGDAVRLILPAFGAYAGGLDVRDPAIARLFPHGCDVHMIARDRVTTLPYIRLRAAG